MRSIGVAAVVIVVALAGCTSGGEQTAPTATTAPTTSPVESTAPASPPNTSPTASSAASTQLTSAAPRTVQQILAAMPEAERVGQLFMVGAASTGTDQAAITAITRYHVGSVILMGQGPTTIARTAEATAGLQRHAGPIGLFVATDQEGGEVQRLRGDGFSSIPSALRQGAESPASLRNDARRWAAQLRAAGVNLDLAPVADTVPSATFAPANPPIGALDREFGFDPGTVARHAIAFAQGLADAGVDATLKHFPGLGRVTGNTDTTAGVTDRTTTRHDEYLAPFATAVQAGAPFVMMSTAYYSRIDPGRPAAFSPTIVTAMLRGDLHFRGVVISDDVGSAAQVAAFPPGARAVDFIAAGGDMVLTVDSSLIGQMAAAVLARARSDAGFHALVDAAALRVLTAKKARGLLSP
jgi:beta-N-acetylhexosaminidase